MRPHHIQRIFANPLDDQPFGCSFTILRRAVEGLIAVAVNDELRGQRTRLNGVHQLTSGWDCRRIANQAALRPAADEPIVLATASGFGRDAQPGKLHLAERPSGFRLNRETAAAGTVRRVPFDETDNPLNANGETEVVRLRPATGKRNLAPRRRIRRRYASE